ASAPAAPPALGSPATRHPRPHRAVTATPTPSSAVRSSAPAGRPRSLLASVRCRRVCPSGAWPSSQPPWLPLIPPLAGEMSKEIGSDLPNASPSGLLCRLPAFSKLPPWSVRELPVLCVEFIPALIAPCFQVIER